MSIFALETLINKSQLSNLKLYRYYKSDYLWQLSIKYTERNTHDIPFKLCFSQTWDNRLKSSIASIKVRYAMCVFSVAVSNQMHFGSNECLNSNNVQVQCMPVRRTPTSRHTFTWDCIVYNCMWLIRCKTDVWQMSAGALWTRCKFGEFQKFW